MGSKNHFDNNLKELRKENGYSQREVAEVISVSQRVYSNYERGEKEPSIDTLIKLSKLFKTTIDYILCNENKRISTMEENEMKIFNKYNKLEPKNKDIIEEVMESLIKHQ